MVIVDIEKLEPLLFKKGSKEMKTTKVFTHILGINSKTLTSPLDVLFESAIFESE